MGVGKNFSRGATRGFSQIFLGKPIVKFVFSLSKLRKQPFLLKFSKSRGCLGPPLPPPFRHPWFYVQSLCLLLHNNFLVFNISDNCCKSSRNLWTLPNHNSRSLEDLGFRAYHSASAQSPSAPLWKPNVLGNYRKVFPLRWRINHFTLNLLSWVYLNII